MDSFSADKSEMQWFFETSTKPEACCSSRSYRKNPRSSYSSGSLDLGLNPGSQLLGGDLIGCFSEEGT